MADLLLDIAGKKLDGNSMMNNLDKQPCPAQPLNVQSSTMNSPRNGHADTALCQMVPPQTPQSILRLPRPDIGTTYIDKEQMYSEDKIKNCSLAGAATQPGLRFDDLAGYSWDYSDLTAAEQRALSSNIPEHVPAGINDEVNSLLSSTESNSHSNLTALLPPITPPPPPLQQTSDQLGFTTSSPVQLGFDDQSVLYNRGLNDYLPSHGLSRDTSINSTLDADGFVAYGFPHSGGKGFVLNHSLNQQLIGANLANLGQPHSTASDGSSTSDDNTDNTVVRRVNV